MNNDRLGQKIEPMYLTFVKGNCVGFLFSQIRNRGFLKNRQNVKHAEGTAAGVSFCLPGVQRTGSPLCLDCKGRQHLAGVKG